MRRGPKLKAPVFGKSPIATMEADIRVLAAKSKVSARLRDPLVDDPDFYTRLADRAGLPPPRSAGAGVGVPPVVVEGQVDGGPRLTLVHKGAPPPAHVAIPIDPKQYPKKWAIEGDPLLAKHKKVDLPYLKRGMIVFYHEMRYWVERVPKSWAESCAVFISDDKIHPDENRLTHDKRESFSVHADLLSEAPQVTRIGAALPTVASAARKERADKGIHDVGDDVAVLLRACKDLEAVYVAAAKFLGLPLKDLKAKYAHLNPGQQRMCCGNQMRFKWKKDNGLVKK